MARNKEKEHEDLEIVGGAMTLTANDETKAA